jgi:hypothetical protein
MGVIFPKVLAGLKPKRRWLRYSLRSLLLFMVLASVLFAWLGRHIARARVPSCIGQIHGRRGSHESQSFCE